MKLTIKQLKKMIREQMEEKTWKDPDFPEYVDYGVLGDALLDALLEIGVDKMNRVLRQWDFPKDVSILPNISVLGNTAKIKVETPRGIKVYKVSVKYQRDETP